MDAFRAIKNFGTSSLEVINSVTLNPLTKLIVSVDSYLRKYDWKKDRNYAPKRISPLHVQGHAKVISTLFLLIPVFLVFGPGLTVRGWLPAGISLAVFSGLGIFLHYKIANEDSLFWIQTSLLLVLSGLLWHFTDVETTVRHQELFRHLLMPALWVLLGGIILARLLALLMFKKFKKNYAKYLKDVELFFASSKVAVNVSWVAYIRSLVTTPFYHFIPLLFLPSMAVIIIADRTWMLRVAIIMLIVTWLYIAASGVHTRLSMMLNVFRGKLFIGGQLVISLVVIVLAIGRLIGNSYISTLIEAHPQQVNLTIVHYIVVAYIFLWFFEYWINRPLLEQLINIFRTRNDNKNRGRIDYPAQNVATSVQKGGRFLQTHGGARFAVVGINKDSGHENWHTYRRVDLFDTLFQKLDLSKPAVYKDFQKCHSIKQRMRFYFLFLNTYLVVAIVLMVLHYSNLPQKPEVQANQLNTPAFSEQHFDLRENLFAVSEANAKSEHAILLAASGGGTRAALYTQSVMRGLQQQNLLKDLVLGSSVSGGSAALAYFAAHRDQLIAGDESKWDEFSSTMAEPFIQDVLEGIVEWRVVGGVEYTDLHTGQSSRMGLRLGDLLAESFDNRFELKNTTAYTHIGKQQQLGLIFNTALVAQFPRWNCKDVQSHDDWRQCLCKADVPVAIQEKQCAELRTKIDQGGRLIFTNLNDVGGFPHHGLHDAPDEHLRYVTVQDGNVELVRAAALSANFPPVFPNSAVDLDGKHRFWVTDGGASDNRGILSLLYALRHAIDEEIKSNTPTGVQRHHPDLHIIIADASATTLQYKDSSGLSAKFGAPARFASQLMVDLADEIRIDYEQALKGNVYFHYLGMPLTLRSNGGLGTHWMRPANIRFNIPQNIQKSNGLNKCDSAKLSGADAQGIIDQLHLMKKTASTLSSQQETVWSWICQDKYTNHQSVWAKILKKTKGTDFINPYCEKVKDMVRCAQ